MRNELARFYHHRTRKCLPPRKLRRDIQKVYVKFCKFAPSLFTKMLLRGYIEEENRDRKTYSLGRQQGEPRRHTSCIGVGSAPSYSTVAQTLWRQVSTFGTRP